MGMPVYDLSGMESIFRSSYLDASISLASCAAQARAYQRCQDLLLHEVFTEGKDTWVLVAVLKAASTLHGAEYISSNLLSAVRKAMRHNSSRFGSSGDSFQVSEGTSPLRTAVQTLDSNYACTSPVAGSLLHQASLSAALIQSSSQSASTLWLGRSSQAPVLFGGIGDQILPAKRAVRYLRHTNFYEAYYTGLSGTVSLILGSPGLWEHVHPALAVANASSHSAPPCPPSIPPDSLPPSLHCPASSVVLAALRRIVHKCSASRDPRLSCLTNVKKLDRIPLGSRAEVVGGIIVPRYRGDVHEDLTAAILTFTCTAAANAAISRASAKPTKTAFGRLRNVKSEGCLVDVLGDGTCTRRKGFGIAMSEATAMLVPRRLRVLSSTSLSSEPRSPTGSRTRGLNSASRPGGSPSSPPACASSTGAASSPMWRSPLSEPSALPREQMARLRWHAVGIYARSIAAELRARQQLWRSAIAAARGDEPLAQSRGVPAPLSPSSAPSVSVPISEVRTSLQDLSGSRGGQLQIEDGDFVSRSSAGGSVPPRQRGQWPLALAASVTA